MIVSISSASPEFRSLWVQNAKRARDKSGKIPHVRQTETHVLFYDDRDTTGFPCQNSAGSRLRIDLFSFEV